MTKTPKALIEIEQYQVKTKKREPHVSKNAVLIGFVTTLAVIIGFSIVCLIKFFA